MNQGLKFFHRWAWLLLIAYLLIGMVFPTIGLIALICMIAPFVTAFFTGRKWCGNFCPRGSLIDGILAKLSLKKKIPVLFKRFWFKMTFLIALMGAFAIQLYFAWGDARALGIVMVRMILITTFLTVILGWIYKPRTWCLICPMGTLAHLVAANERVKHRIEHIALNKDTCSSCRVCSKHCPVDIQVHQYREHGRVIDAGCLKCGKCVAKCPKKSLKAA